MDKYPVSPKSPSPLPHPFVGDPGLRMDPWPLACPAPSGKVAGLRLGSAACLAHTVSWLSQAPLCPVPGPCLGLPNPWLLLQGLGLYTNISWMSFCQLSATFPTASGWWEAFRTTPHASSFIPGSTRKPRTCGQLSGALPPLPNLPLLLGSLQKDAFRVVTGCGSWAWEGPTVRGPDLGSLWSWVSLWVPTALGFPWGGPQARDVSSACPWLQFRVHLSGLGFSLSCPV